MRRALRPAIAGASVPANSLRPHLVSSGERRVSFDPDVEGSRVGEFDHEAIGVHQWAEASASALELVALPASPYAGVKRFLDIVGSLLLAALFCPLILAIVVLMGSEEGAIIYKHRRIGRDGRTFECLKFRTMVPNADQVLRELLERDPAINAEWLRDHKLRCDPRVTRIGRFLRRTSLDELPQLWNVIRGEMSLVGPRPVVREELLRYGRNVRAYLSAKPGITGLWQIKGRNDTDYRRRVALDAYYVRNQNLLLDLYILLQTTRVVLGGIGAY
jgi:exopolysaccharide production protein ExoY